MMYGHMNPAQLYPPCTAAVPDSMDSARESAVHDGMRSWYYYMNILHIEQRQLETCPHEYTERREKMVLSTMMNTVTRGVVV